VFGIRSKSNQRESVKDSSHGVAQLLVELLQRCPHCESRFLGHEYALLASRAVTNEKDGALVSFFGVIKEHHWLELRKFQSWQGNADDVEAYAIRCSGPNVTVAVIKTRFELFEGARLLYSEVLSKEEGTKLLHTLIDLQWHEL